MYELFDLVVQAEEGEWDEEPVTMVTGQPLNI